jgi:hypothetical protein
LTLNPSHRFDGDTVIQGTLDAYKILQNGSAISGSDVLGTDKGLITANTAYDVGDIVTLRTGTSGAGYRRVIITTAVTSGASPTFFISASKYKPLTTRMPGLNVQDFGAIGNAATDDTAAIQAAIDQASSGAASTGGGGVVFFPAGYYVVSSTIVLKRHVYLIGEGQRNSVIKLEVNANCNVIKSFDTGGASGNADYTGIINMCIDGNKTNQNGAGPYHGIVYNTNPANTIAAGDFGFDMHHLLQNVMVYRAKGNGVDCTGRSAIQMYNVDMSQNAVYGFKSTYDMTIVGCEAESNGSSGFVINNASVKLIGCKAYLNGATTPTTDGAGFKIGNVGPCELVGCEAQNNQAAGYNFVSADRIIMAGCNADSNNTSNSVVDTDRVGVSLVGSTNCIIDVVCNETPQGGVQIGHQGYGLHIDGASANNDIRMTQSASGAPATIIGDITPTSVPGTNDSIQINSVRATPFQWGTPTGTTSTSPDTNLYRSAANTLATDDDFAMVTAGKGLKVAEGSNAKMGITAAMTAGSIVVSTTAVTANSRIFLTAQNTGGTAGALRVSARTAATSFTITSTSGSDTSTVAWMIVEPA